MRLYMLPEQSSPTPLNVSQITYKEGWVSPAPDTLGCGAGCFWDQFSAACWYTGRDVYDRLNGSVPIGLLHSSYGGTVVASWTSPDSNTKCGPVIAPPPGSGAQNNASECYNAMLYPLLPLRIASVVCPHHTPHLHTPSTPQLTPLTWHLLTRLLPLSASSQGIRARPTTSTPSATRAPSPP
jgi:hypothetical protein